MKYFARRLAHATLLLLAVSIFSFAILQSAPGDFFSPMALNPQISSRTINGLRSQYGLDRSLPTRYAHWLHGVLNGDLGPSLSYNSPVAPLLAVRARNTLLLTGTAMLLAWLIAIPLGMWSAVHRGKWGDRAAGVVTSGLLTVPDLVLFLVLLLVAARTGWFPTGGMVSSAFSDLSVWNKVKDIAEHLFLPALGLAIATLPPLVRHVRSAMIEVLGAPFIRAARAHGIAERRVLFRYALPVAANPLVSLFGLSVATMLSASLLVEVVLSWPGIGPLLVDAILAKDVYVVIGAVMLSSIFLVAGNLFADLLLFAADPRMRVE
ncbi:MAG TPA: ABC transporter permease [Candidatus Acidoferrales bacterium]|nr:ABC transporter permease [Candidatus Acidoferrales bacterium]